MTAKEWLQNAKSGQQQEAKSPVLSVLQTMGQVAAAPIQFARRNTNQSTLEELFAMGRQGREDVFNNLLTAFPAQTSMTREPGTPGNPTQQITTENVYGRSVDRKTDIVQLTKANEPSQARIDAEKAQMQGNERSRDGMER